MFSSQSHTRWEVPLTLSFLIQLQFRERNFRKKLNYHSGKALTCLICPFWIPNWWRKVREQSKSPCGHPGWAGLFSPSPSCDAEQTGRSKQLPHILPPSASLTEEKCVQSYAGLSRLTWYLNILEIVRLRCQCVSPSKPPFSLKHWWMYRAKSSFLSFKLDLPQSVAGWIALSYTQSLKIWMWAWSLNLQLDWNKPHCSQFAWGHLRCVEPKIRQK